MYEVPTLRAHFTDDIVALCVVRDLGSGERRGQQEQSICVRQAWVAS